MSKISNEVRLKACDIAERAVKRYARGILTVPSLVEQMLQATEGMCPDEDVPSQAILSRNALRICSSALCAAWHSSDSSVRDCAFDNLRHCLEWALLHSRYVSALQRYTGAIEDVLHQTLEVLYLQRERSSHAGPSDPASFLKWTQTILLRQALHFLRQSRRDECLSLEVQMELSAEQFVDEGNSDPLEEVMQRESRQTLAVALLSLRNPRYSEVLIYTYLVGLDEQELARRFQVNVQDVYLWRHRALKALRRRPEVMEVLRSLRE